MTKCSSPSALLKTYQQEEYSVHNIDRQDLDVLWYLAYKGRIKLDTYRDRSVNEKLTNYGLAYTADGRNWRFKKVRYLYITKQGLRLIGEL